LKPILILELRDVPRWFDSWEESNKTLSPPLSMMKHKFAADLETKEIDEVEVLYNIQVPRTSDFPKDQVAIVLHKRNNRCSGQSN
jgi:hypothetical protein